jgi:starch synthase (maltosyl-transferring)
MTFGPRIYQFDPALEIDAWASHLPRIAAMGFTWVRVPPLAEASPASETAFTAFVDDAERAGAGVIVDIAIPAGSEAVLATSLAADALRYAERGARGFLCLTASAVPATMWTGVLAELRATAPDAVVIADTLGSSADAIDALRPAGFDYLLNSSAWWDFSSGWLLDQYDRYRHVAPSIAFPLRVEPGTTIAETRTQSEFRYLFAAFFSSGVMMPMGFEQGPDGTLDLAGFITGVNGMKAGVAALNEEGPQYAIKRNGLLAGLVRRTESGTSTAVAIVNPDVSEPLTIDLHRARGIHAVDTLIDTTPGMPPLPLRELTLGARSIRVYASAPDRVALAVAAPPAGDERAHARPCIIEDITPQIDGGRHPAKRLAGEPFRLEASVFREGHDALAAVVRYRAAGAAQWYETPMEPIGNDRWAASFVLAENTQYDYLIEAWPDDAATWTHDIDVKHAAGLDIALELTEGRALFDAARERAGTSHSAAFAALFAAYDAASTNAEQLAVLHSAEAARLLAIAPDRSRSTLSTPALRVIADRRLGQTGAWYEFFPRSQSRVPGRHGTFADSEEALARISELGFDVVYLPPIHPIGVSFRKGPNNSLTPGPGDPGSPWAIGNADGGHRAVEPALGTIADFDRFVARAHGYGLEIALDYALQCSPDHPYVREHPEWFAFRPDGTIKYAENPPKKYQDIVNFQWFGPHAPALWNELRDVVDFWIGHGVRIFRVDNPHTKPFAFWEWMIADIHSRNPDIIFLAEAFTRPHVMAELAKVGFTQSYTYFTWRTSKWELTQYLTELTTAPLADVYRPNFFPNTPDILPPFLQTGGRPAFLIRLYLAATLASSYGIYAGFEICEHAALPGREEYADSEKYQLRQRDLDAPGNINDHIARINRIRRAHPAFDDWRNIRFHDADHDQVIFFSKTQGADTVLIAINLDPFTATDVRLHLPLSALGYSAGEPIAGENLLTGDRFTWYGPDVMVWLNPAETPALIVRIDRRLPLALTIPGA